MSNPVSSLEIDPNLKAVLIGGGAVPEDSKSILQAGLEQAGSENPSVLVVGTASKSKEYYDDWFARLREAYSSLGIPADRITQLHPYLLEDIDAETGVEYHSKPYNLTRLPSDDEIADRIGSASVIYTPGGNTEKMVEIWERSTITDRLREAASNGTLMSGHSAGMLAWFELGHSDSSMYDVEKGMPWEYKLVAGLGHVAAIGVPHYDSETEGKDGVPAEPREANFAKILDSQGTSSIKKLGIGIDNNAALQIDDGQVRALQGDGPSGNPGRRGVFIIDGREGVSEKVQIAPNQEFSRELK